MVRKKFKLSHSILGLALLIGLQALCLMNVPALAFAWLTPLFAVIGSVALIYVATEVIEEVRNAQHMLLLLSAVVGEFIIFFAFEYWFLILVSTTSFPSLPTDFLSLLVHSTMMFVFNPLYLPGNGLGRALLLINTGGALGLVLFILQNVWQFRRNP